MKSIPVDQEVSLGGTTVDRLEHFVSALKRDEQTIVSVELLMGSLFPQLYKNFEQRMKNEHMAGFLEGYEAKSKEIESEGNN